MRILSVNVGRPRTAADRSLPDSAFAAGLASGIDKRPVAGPVAVAAPGPKGEAGSGLAGDAVVSWKHHGGNDQAVYAFAREDLDRWERQLGRTLPDGSFGENLTTSGVDVSGARIGERWRVGGRLLLEVTSPRVPCRTFADWLGERGWMRRFTEEAAPGAYLRVLEPGEVRAGDPVTVVHRPGHEVSVAFAFRARTTERALLPRVLAAGDGLHPDLRAKAERYVASPPAAEEVPA
ncbi:MULTISPECIES: MOSC domain-containing protein [Streptomyces]|uniref:MOSC domain-containing protein n=1 Tax=Streptomyces TaxID=1883 RepID=UPI00163C46BF|nr:MULTISPECIES: MOSC domain-containing protein [Streptomyces]MBC2875948.1 MOSC domain-containing protein [Streptomyces sp. TYQ1024]UBI38317.1 MOSC domain-containing protein [Streptomyces mobaraensis]UKW30902.1 MOSC domain-containing protein [Streptomyces sp. TYQ1024]